jgi:DNA repair exonuclease SbcCD ATPase subunit
VDERVADTLAGLESRDETANAEARIQLAQLADNHEQLGSAVGRLEEQVSAARAEFGSRAPQDQNQATRLEQRLADLQGQLSTVLEQVDERVADTLAGLESRDETANAEARIQSSSAAPSGAWKSRCQRPGPTSAPGLRRIRTRHRNWS